MPPTLTKQQVNYRPALLVKLGERCGTCVMFRPDGSCTLVKGRISRLAVCDRWAGKAGK